MSNEFNNEENPSVNFEDLIESIMDTDEETVEELSEEQENIVDLDDEEPEAKVADLPIIPVLTEKDQRPPVSHKVAVHSTRNVTWNGVGKVYIGYNIVTQEQADQWVTRNHIRLATPEEVAKEFGL